MRLSQRVRKLSFSVTLALDARAKELAAQGRDLVNMAVGEPDFPAPAAARRAAVSKVESGEVRYTAAAGAHSTRAAIARHLTETRGLPFQAEDVVVCHSAKHALSGVILSLVEPGDEVLVPLPAWVSYVEQIHLAGAEPVLVPPTPDCSPDVAALRAAVTPRTRMILINSPSNPTGYVLSEAEVRAVVELARARDLWILSDEIYRRLVYDGATARSPVMVDPHVRDRTVIVDGASKAFAMTGYRIGYAAGPREVVSAVTRLHSQMTGAPNAVSQAAFEAALGKEPPEVAEMCRVFARRRDLLVEGLRGLGLSMPAPGGAFYAFPSVAALLDERGSEGFCEDLLEDEGLVIVPGSAFGVDDHVRFSYALAEGAIQDALARFERFLAARI